MGEIAAEHLAVPGAEERIADAAEARVGVGDPFEGEPGVGARARSRAGIDGARARSRAEIDGAQARDRAAEERLGDAVDLGAGGIAEAHAMARREARAEARGFPGHDEVA